MKKIEHIEEEGVTEELFSDLIFEVFTAQLSNGVEVFCERERTERGEAPLKPPT